MCCKRRAGCSVQTAVQAAKAPRLLAFPGRCLSSGASLPTAGYWSPPLTPMAAPSRAPSQGLADLDGEKGEAEARIQACYEAAAKDLGLQLDKTLK